MMKQCGFVSDTIEVVFLSNRIMFTDFSSAGNLTRTIKSDLPKWEGAKGEHGFRLVMQLNKD